MNCIFDQSELKYNQVELKKNFTLFLIVYFLDCHNNWPKLIVQNVLIRLLVEGVISNNWFRENNFFLWRGYEVTFLIQSFDW